MNDTRLNNQAENLDLMVCRIFQNEESLNLKTKADSYLSD